MQNIITRIVDFFRRRTGRQTTLPEASDTSTTPQRCAICKTEVSDLDQGCPLCGSSILNSKPSSEATGSKLDPTTVRRTAMQEDNAVEKLSAIRQSPMDILVQYDDRWEPIGTDDGRTTAYRIRLPDGGTDRVQTMDALRSVLLDAYGIPSRGADSVDSSTETES